MLDFLFFVFGTFDGTPKESMIFNVFIELFTFIIVKVSSQEVNRQTPCCFLILSCKRDKITYINLLQLLASMLKSNLSSSYRLAI